MHRAYQPFAWQIGWALELCGRLLNSRKAAEGEAWSIANSVEIIDVEKMQAALEDHFLGGYDHGAWLMIRRKPEALVFGWSSTMEVMPTIYRPVIRTRTIWDRLRAAFRALTR